MADETVADAAAPNADAPSVSPEGEEVKEQTAVEEGTGGGEEGKGKAKKRKGGGEGAGKRKKVAQTSGTSVPVVEMGELQQAASTGFGFAMHASGSSSVTGTMQIPQAYVGNVIGKGGFTIKTINQGTGCEVTIEKEVIGAATRDVTLRGTAQSVAAAQQMIMMAIQAAVVRRTVKRDELGRKADEVVVERRIRGPREKLGWIIGQKGATIKAIRTISGANLEILEEETAGTIPVGCIVIRGGGEAVSQAAVAVEGLLAYSDARLARQYSTQLQETAEQLLAWRNGGAAEAAAAAAAAQAPPASTEAEGPEGGAEATVAAAAAAAGAWETVITKHPDGTEVKLYKHSVTGEIRWG